MAKGKRKQRETAESEKVTVVFGDLEITGTKATVDGETVTVHDAEVSVAPPALPVPAADGETYCVRQTGTVTGLAGDHRIVCWDAGDRVESIYVGDNASPEFTKLHYGQRFEAIVERSTQSGMVIRILEVLPLPPVDEEQQAPTSPLLPPHLVRTLRYVPTPGIFDYEDQIVLRKDFPAVSTSRVDAGWELFSLTPERRNNGLEYITIWRRIKVRSMKDEG